MFVDDEMLAPFKDADGLCRMHGRIGGGWRYQDHAELAERMREDALGPKPLFDGLRFSHTFEQFRPTWDQAPRGHRSVLVLAFLARVPLLPPSREWLALQHQGAGHACAHRPMIAAVLSPRGAVQSAFDRIAAENHHACGGWLEGPETDAAVTRRYLERIGELGLQCSERSLFYFCESVYPADVTSEALACVTDDGDDLLGLFFHPVVEARPLLLALSENSD